VFAIVYIALVCPYDLQRPGGVRSHIVGLGRALMDRGHRVEIVSPGSFGTFEGLPLMSCGRARSLSFGGTRIDLTWAGWNELRSTARRGYDVVHFHTIWNPAMPLQLAAAFRGPKVATFHDVAGPHTPWLARAAMAPAASVINALFLHRAIAVSPVVSRHLRMPHDVIPNGITSPAVGDQRSGARSGIVFVGRLEPRKGADTLLRAFAQLGADAPSLRIIGDGGLRPSLQLFAETHGLSRVEFLGELGDRAKWEELRRAEILVAPSVGGESFGIVLTEAMSAGAVPIASDIPGYRHVLGAMAPELTFPPDDATALAERVRGFAGNSGRLEILREWGTEHVRQFHWSKLVERVERVYESAARAN
jgi:phosphatidylinositol alpha-mannosyltransferase